MRTAQVRRGVAWTVAALAVAGLAPAASAAGPTITYTVRPSAVVGDNGWYRSNVTADIQVQGAIDTTCPSVRTFQSVADALDCSATDGSATTSFHLQFKIDKDAPSATTNVARGPNANGWYNAPVAVGFTGTDPTSGFASCSPQVSYAGPDNANASVSGTCRDVAGNVSAQATRSLKYDATAPAVTVTPDRGPNATGWYTAPVQVNFGRGDGTSGLASCTPATNVPSTTYTGPDSGAANVSASCTDAAGNQSQAAFTFAYDTTAPGNVGASVAPPDSNGWYNHAFTIGFSGSDPTSGIAECSNVRYDGPDAGSASVSGTCRDNAGNTSGAASFGFQYDATAPSVRAAPSRGPDANGWYNHALPVGFEGSDATSGVSSCTSGNYGGPDSAAAGVSGSCADKAGNGASASFGLKYDATPPSVTAQPARAPDGGGWYNHALTIGFSGSDGLAGLDSCTSATYGGPDTAGADVTGSCRDLAGNSATRSVTVRYDATAPTLREIAAVPGDKSVRLAWKASADVAGVTVTRAGPKGAPTRRYAGGGRSFLDKGLVNGTRYRYTVAARDAAGNVASKTVAAVPLALFAPPQGARLSAPPLMQWKSLPKADYYNLQVMHQGKVLSVWPTVPRFRMPERWRFGGTPHFLEPGLYRWYVWPGFGPRSKADYGPRIGGSFFVVVKS
jgi:hypothetical protein